ncbi:peptide MFS transporter [Steroidobacter sp.]|uniref:peptide MFS transporter n=1 Tax=Steroidobacter sp. TaxID=1978227 RepID=UPI001A495438|nr:peptide MFS transporter [Steroidobacter sp.]MBL8267988.1 peptide MFS transporter [Steroidobacter sp.]
MSDSPAQRYRHPAGVYLVSATEMWERFSYYGITALLVLYLTAPVVADGFGWSAPEAIRLYGLYAGLAFAAPAFGGWVSSSVLGERRCILWGGAAIMLGHVLLGGPAYLPALLGAFSGVPVEEVLRQSALVQGRLLLDSAQREGLRLALLNVTGSDANLGAVSAAYVLRSWSFFGGLALVIVGTALIKPTISSIMGKLYAPDDPKRVFGFTLFMMGVWTGSFCANFVAGSLGERFGWHLGFMAAAVGMAIGLGAYAALQRKLLANIGERPDHTGSMRTWFARFTRLTPAEKHRLRVLAMLSAFTVVYGIAFYQKAGFIHLLVRESVVRDIGGFEVPAAWFLSISTGGFLLFAPMVSYVMARARRQPDAAQCLVMGLASLACGYVIFLLAATWAADANGMLSMAWIVAAYLCFGLGDVFIWPPQLAAVTALAPASMTSFIVGLWYVTVGAGAYGAGLVGAWARETGTQTGFTVLLVMLVVATLLAFALRRWMTVRPASWSRSDLQGVDS